MPRVLVPLADGFEEMEGIIVIDVLRRAGIEVVTASLTGEVVTAARHTRHLADQSLDAVLSQDFDMIILPGGGPGAVALEKDVRIKTKLLEFNSKNKPIAAICAAPNVLRSHGILKDDDRFTMHPDAMPKSQGGQYVKDRIVHTRNITTSVGPGSSFEFALELVEQLCGKEKRDAVAGPMHLP
ncbi:MAG: DJ-1/PfpI family protein [Spirochaetia bacterium]|nr:DJ-1/PfpI family protein [Spirochaetia bacterium]